MSARALGLTCDNILEAEIVMADGSVRNVNASDPLFWALQFQARWSDPADDSTDQYINWVREVRTALAAQGLTDGGFFNFQDASIAPETDRYALMKYYYGINLDQLIDLKIQHDPTNVFQSGMSIPNKKR
jgi:hypothetical protein